MPPTCAKIAQLYAIKTLAVLDEVEVDTIPRYPQKSFEFYTMPPVSSPTPASPSSESSSSFSSVHKSAASDHGTDDEAGSESASHSSEAALITQQVRDEGFSVSMLACIILMLLFLGRPGSFLTTDEKPSASSCLVSADGVMQYPLGIRTQLDAMIGCVSQDYYMAAPIDWLSLPPLLNRLDGIFPSDRFEHANEYVIEHWQTLMEPASIAAKTDDIIDEVIQKRTSGLVQYISSVIYHQPEPKGEDSSQSCNSHTWQGIRSRPVITASEIRFSILSSLESACGNITSISKRLSVSLHELEEMRTLIFSKVENIAFQVQAKLRSLHPSASSIKFAPGNFTEPYWHTTSRANTPDIDGSSTSQNHSLLGAATVSSTAGGSFAIKLPSATHQLLLHQLMSDLALVEFLSALLSGYASVETHARASCLALPSLLPAIPSSSGEVEALRSLKRALHSSLPRLFRPDPYALSCLTERKCNEISCPSAAQRLLRDLLRNSTRAHVLPRLALPDPEALKLCLADFTIPQPEEEARIGLGWNLTWDFWLRGASPHWWINTSGDEAEEKAAVWTSAAAAAATDLAAAEALSALKGAYDFGPEHVREGTEEGRMGRETFEDPEGSNVSDGKLRRKLDLGARLRVSEMEEGLRVGSSEWE